MKLKMSNKIPLRVTFLIFVVTLMFLLSACGQKPGPSTSDKTGQKDRSNWPKAINIGSSPIGGNWYIMATSMGEHTSKALGITMTPEATTGSSQNISLIQKGEMELAFASGDSLYDSVRGIGDYKTQGKASVSLLWNSGPTPLLFVTRMDSGIKKFNDLKGKRLMSDLTGSPTIRMMVTELLEQHGLTRKDVEVLPYSAKEEGITGLTEKTISVFSTPTGPSGPNSAYLQIQDNIDAYYLPLGEQEVKNILKKSPYFSEFVIKPNTYENQPEPLRVLAFNAVFVAANSLPDDLVYEYMKSVWDNLDTIKGYHPAFGGWSLESAVKLPIAPFHPGAIKYYKEKGIWTPELEQKQQELIKEAS